MVLEKISYETIEKCLAMKIREDQKSFVTSNDVSLAHAFLALEEGQMIPYPYLLKEDEQYVGFLMLSYCKPNPQDLVQRGAYCIWRFMIDERYQKKGYGKTAVQKAIELAREQFAGPADHIVLFVEPDNKIAVRLYEQCGFTKTNETIDGETKYIRALK